MNPLWIFGPPILLMLFMVYDELKRMNAYNQREE